MSIVVLDGNGEPQTIATIDDLIAIVATAALQGTANATLVSILAALGTGATAANQVALEALIGEVQASPTANTLLARLKAITDPLPLALGGLGGLKTERVTQTVTIAANSTAFPLGSNVLFPARAGGRVRVELYNPPTNHAVTITFSSGFSFVLQPGGSYVRTAESHIRGSIDGAITAIGTATEIVQAEEAYL